jgi:hypothetical protein
MSHVEIHESNQFWVLVVFVGNRKALDQWKDMHVKKHTVNEHNRFLPVMISHVSYASIGWHTLVPPAVAMVQKDHFSSVSPSSAHASDSVCLAFNGHFLYLRLPGGCDWSKFPRLTLTEFFEPPKRHPRLQQQKRGLARSTNGLFHSPQYMMQ